MVKISHFAHFRKMYDHVKTCDYVKLYCYIAAEPGYQFIPLSIILNSLVHPVHFSKTDSVYHYKPILGQYGTYWDKVKK